MDYSADKPISSSKDDLLNRSIFSKQLAKALYEYKSKDGLVIGLYGKWGTGKTSVLNMALEELKSLDNSSSKLTIIKFSPWNYSDKDNLISIFFKVLDNKINGGANNNLKKVGSTLKKYANVVDIFNVVPGLNAVTPTLKTIMEATGTYFSDIDLDTVKKDLEDALIEAKHRIIIVIDDIDRLTNSQIKDIFQLVKQLADFPYVTYILLMDREIVSRALLDVHNIDGNMYLEKIVQIPFEIPVLNKVQLENIFCARLEEKVKSIAGKIDINQNYWGMVFQNCVLPYINTLRNINQIINVFQFKYEVLYKETCLEDFIAITTIEVLEPKLYEWVYKNKNLLINEYSNLSEKSNIENNKDYNTLFKQMGIDAKKAISFLSIIFPRFARSVNELTQSSYSLKDEKDTLKISYENKFDLYFSFNLDSIKISRADIESCIYNMDEETFIEYIDEIQEKGLLYTFMREIYYLVDYINESRLSIVTSSILNFSQQVKYTNTNHKLKISLNDLIDSIVYKLIKKNNVENRYCLIDNAIEQMNINNIDKIAALINTIEIGYGRPWGEERGEIEEIESYQLISLQQLEEIERHFEKKISNDDLLKKLIDLDRFNIVFYLWSNLDKNSSSRYIDKLFQNDINRLKFVCHYMDGKTGTEGVNWEYSEKRCSQYVKEEDAYSIIEKLDKNEFEKFSKVNQIKLASIYLNYKSIVSKRVNENQVIECLDRWKFSNKTLIRDLNKFFY